MTATRLIACHECDLLQRETALGRGGAARCRRCGATLYKSLPASVDRTLALTLAALVLFGVANAFPIVGLSVNGTLVEMTLYKSLPASVDRTLALTLAALVLFGVANAFPIVGLSVNGTLV
ncbi:paraquat-inducible protein A, partial [Caballeronia sp. M23-90]